MHVSMDHRVFITVQTVAIRIQKTKITFDFGPSRALNLKTIAIRSQEARNAFDFKPSPARTPKTIPSCSRKTANAFDFGSSRAQNLKTSCISLPLKQRMTLALGHRAFETLKPFPSAYKKQRLPLISDDRALENLK
jgi:hypothetical protein